MGISPNPHSVQVHSGMCPTLTSCTTWPLHLVACFHCQPEACCTPATKPLQRSSEPLQHSPNAILRDCGSELYNMQHTVQHATRYTQGRALENGRYCQKVTLAGPSAMVHPQHHTVWRMSDPLALCRTLPNTRSAGLLMSYTLGRSKRRASAVMSWQMQVDGQAMFPAPPLHSSVYTSDEWSLSHYITPAPNRAGEHATLLATLPIQAGLHAQSYPGLPTASPTQPPPHSWPV